MRFLLVDDEEKLGQALRRRLEQDGHWVDVVADGAAALGLATERTYSVILLDLMLPDSDGFTVCRQLRDHAVWAPVLIISARDGVRDRVRGLDAGADDYLVKPFVVAELLARVRALLRRTPAERPAVLTVEDLVLDPATRAVTRGGRPIELSVREYTLLEFLVRNRGSAVDRSLIAQHVWGHDQDRRSNVADVYVGYLRRKLDRAGEPPLIRTVRGVGYQVGRS